MSIREKLFNHPQQVFLRQALFQVHLWSGIILAIYMVAIGVSGSILVFRDELQRSMYPKIAVDPGKPLAQVSTVIGNIQSKFPNAKVTGVYAPKERGEPFVAYLQNIMPQRKGLQFVLAHPNTGRIVGEIDIKTNWLAIVADLHFRLLAGRSGLIANGIGAIFLLVLCITGAMVWWPGIRHWKRAFTVDFRRRWKRVNFDLHSAVGFWTLSIMSIWALSGIYFVWPEQFTNAVAKVMPTSDQRAPEIKIPEHKGRQSAELEPMINRAQAASGGKKLQGVMFPSAAGQPLTIYFGSPNPNTLGPMDFFYFDPYTAKQVGTWHRFQNEKLGDKFIWLMFPLHFGIYWGMAVKIIWAMLGLALPLLTVTGILMYWNRVLHKKWKHLKARTPVRASEVATAGDLPQLVVERDVAMRDLHK